MDKSKLLTEEDFQRAAAAIGCEVAAIRAVCEVEAPKGGFLEDGRVRVLFERHKFHKYSGGVWSAKYPDVSNPAAGGYGPEGAHQYASFSKAFRLDPKAAMKSCSWGKFQVMGFNFAAAGFKSLDEFVNAMKESEGRQLDAFVAFVLSQALGDELRRCDWKGFARQYNGVAYAKNRYDVKLAAAYMKYRRAAPASQAASLPVEEVVGYSLADDLEDVEPEPVETHQDPTPQTIPTPARPESPAPTIKAIPPLPSYIPNAAKQAFAWITGGGLLSIIPGLVYLKGNPELLLALLALLKWFFIGLAQVASVGAIGFALDRMWKAKLANDLNIVRYRSANDKTTDNRDFSGWADAPAPGTHV